MNSGMTIRRARERKGLGRDATAKRAGIPKDTLKKIESGKTGASLSMLERIALAIGVPVAELVDGDGEREHQQDSIEGAQTHPTVPGPTPDRLRAEVGVLSLPSQRVGGQSPEYWLVKGDEEAGKGHWTQALEYYRRGAQLMGRHDYTWARLMLERVGQILINLNAFDQLDGVIQEVQNDYQQGFIDRFGREEPHISMLIEEKQAWKKTWQGHVGPAISHASAAMRLAHELGDERVVESTGLHFTGRALCEEITSCMLYDRLFPHLTLGPRGRARLDTASAYLLRCDVIEARTDSIGFNAQWKARIWRTQGKIYDARKQDRYWRQYFGKAELAAEAKLDLAKLILIERDGQHDTAFSDATDMLCDIEATFRGWQYAPGLAEAATTRAYILYLQRRFNTCADRRNMADWCVLSLCLHPHPQHPNFKIAQHLLTWIASLMDPVEVQGYEESLLARVTARESPFDALRCVFALDTTVLVNLVPLRRLISPHTTQ